MKRLAFLLATIVIGVAIAAFFFRSAPAPEPAAPLPELLSYAPPDASMIVYLDAAALRASPLFHRLAALLPPVREDEDYANFVRATGFEYQRDLSRALVIVSSEKSGRGAIFADTEEPLARNRLLAFAKGQGQLREIPGGAGVNPIYQLDDMNTPGSNAFTFFSDKRIGLAQDREKLDAADLLRRPAAPLANDQAMRERIERVAGAAIFSVVRLDKMPAEQSKAAQDNWLARRFGDIGEGVKWLTFFAHPESDRLRVQFAAECDGVWNATQLGFMLDGAQLLARQSLKDSNTQRQMTPQQYVLFEHVAQSSAIQREGRMVYLRFELTSAVLGAATPPQTGR